MGVFCDELVLYGTSLLAKQFLGTILDIEVENSSSRFGRQRRKCLENGTWEEGSGWCDKISCPPVSLLDHVRVFPTSCLSGQQNFKTKCRLSCPQGFSFQGSRAAFCGKRGKWVFRNGPTKCSPEVAPPGPPGPAGPQYSQIPPTDPPLVPTTPLSSPSPYIVCPPDISLNLTGQPPLEVQLPRPRTNVDWQQDVVSHPAEAKSLSFYQGPGNVEVKFEAANRVTREIASCKVNQGEAKIFQFCDKNISQFWVRVKDVSPPVVTFCPQSKSVFLKADKVRLRPIS